MGHFTPDQQLAITARGNVLVEAGAGSGKTHTLVQRCLARVLDPVERVSLDRILMVTFTEAAAAEMRRRIAVELSRLRNAPDQLSNKWSDHAALTLWLDEQLALLDQARISTLHSFCLELIRENFHHPELKLDPQLAVMDEGQSGLMARETMDSLLGGYYEDTTPFGGAVRELIMSYGGGDEAAIRELVLQVHRHMRSLDDPQGWLAAQREGFESDHPQAWRAQLAGELGMWKQEWLATLAGAPRENLHAAKCHEILSSFDPDTAGADIAATVESILAVDASDWNRRKTRDREILASLFDEAAFLRLLFLPPKPRDGQAGTAGSGLDEDWAWIRRPMQTLLGLVREFDASYAEGKRERGVLDFADLEQFALKVLWNPRTGEPTPAAMDWQERLDLVFVDEYQDINAAQDRILSCVSRSGARANRFLVGDVKQSIYRFRLANPHIFQRYAMQWRLPDAQGSVISLADNFRSHEAMLDFINRLFAGLMKPSVGGVDYGDNARLRFGNAEGRPAMAVLPSPQEIEDSQPPRVEMCLRKTQTRSASGAEGDGEHVPDVEAEARMIVARLKELKQSGFEIVEDGKEVRRPVEWRDMVVLLRSPGTRAEAYAREFARHGLTLEVSRGGFYERTEISDLLNLLTILDNPLQDIPLLAVLRSPLVGLTLNELAALRLARQQCRCWEALRSFHGEFDAFQAGFRDRQAVLDAASTARPKINRFLRQYTRWRHLARQGSLARCLESVLAETLYEDWLKGRPGGDQSAANVRRLCAMARRFDQFQRQGLYRFLNYVKETQDSGARDEIAPAADADAVRLMSIHNSKGQEFPVVVVAGLGTRFNTKDLQKDVILDEVLGLCPMVFPPGRPARYPSLGHWMAARRQRRELLGEEIRLLYVALTRARDKLLLAATVSEKDVEHFSECDCRSLEETAVALAGRTVDWVGPLMGGVMEIPRWCSQESGRKGWFAWRIVGDITAVAVAPTTPVPTDERPVDAMMVEEVARRLSWVYPHESSTHIPAKTTVTDARRRLAETDEESALQFQTRWPQKTAASSGQAVGADAGLLSPAEAGIAHHTFLEHVDLGNTATAEGLQGEVKNMIQQGRLTPGQASALNMRAMESFWRSPVGSAIREHADRVRREMPFTARFNPKEAGFDAETDDGEFVVVQGVVDLVVTLDEETWIVDFKTDAVTASDLPFKVKAYRPQLRLYSKALEKLLGRPVTRAWLHFLSLDHTCEIRESQE